MIETLTAAAIAKLAFDAAIQTGAGKLTEAAIEKGKQLWQKIRGKVKEEGVKETTLVEVENQKSLDVLEQQVVPFLQVAMLKDSQFAQEIQNIAQQINQEIREGSQDLIEQKDFETHDSSVVAGKIEGREQYIGGSHTHEKK
jgi:phenylalanyl-tRNA synthetase alpha subunit